MKGGSSGQALALADFDFHGVGILSDFQLSNPVLCQRPRFVQTFLCAKFIGYEAALWLRAVKGDGRWPIRPSRLEYHVRF